MAGRDRREGCVGHKRTAEMRGKGAHRVSSKRLTSQNGCRFVATNWHPFWWEGLCAFEVHLRSCRSSHFHLCSGMAGGTLDLLKLSDSELAVLIDFVRTQPWHTLPPAVLTILNNLDAAISASPSGVTPLATPNVSALSNSHAYLTPAPSRGPSVAPEQIEANRGTQTVVSSTADFSSFQLTTSVFYATRSKGLPSL